jgi:rare lipoprotein A
MQAKKIRKKTTQKVVVDTAKNKVIAVDTIKPRLKLKAFKTKAHASYYHNKFNGKRTSSGIRFSNDKYTAAHRKLPFGTKLKVTNEDNGKWVIVEVIDRGPFSRGREIDLSRRAFMEIASNKNSGVTIVKLEIIEN